MPGARRRGLLGGSTTAFTAWRGKRMRGRPSRLLTLCSLLISFSLAATTQEEDEQLLAEFAQIPVNEEELGRDLPQEEVASDNLAGDDNAFLMSLSKPLGEISGMAMDKQGRLIVFHRADRIWEERTFDEKGRLRKGLGPIKNDTIAVIDIKTGQVLEEHGSGLFFLPHGLTVDPSGNVWVTDVGSHQVHKLGADWKPVLSLGVRGEPGSGPAHFCQPTDVAVATNGYFFVSDGYCNSRVVKFNPSGKQEAIFMAPDGEEGSSPFAVPHSLALIQDMNLLCVADRENERVQCYSAGLVEGHRSIPSGIPITSAENIGRVYAIREKNHYLVGVTGEDLAGQLPSQMFVMDMKSGQATTFLKGIKNAHAVAVADDGKVFIGQMHPNQIVIVDLAL